MSHELRTPLNAIIGFGQLLEMDELAAEQHQQVEHILSGGRHLAVSDTGYGISSEDLKQLFVPFERLNAGSSEIEGTGLGLALSKHLMEAMSGSIMVETTEGRGSTFTIKIPLATLPVEPLALEDNFVPTLTQKHVPEHTILYVEDNLSNLSLVKHLFSKRPQIHLITAMQGWLGLDLAREHRPDLILLDLHLPNVPGWEVLRLLQEDPTTSNIPVVIVSADATAPQVQRLLEAGARAYLTKPLDVKKFLQTLEETLR